MHDYVINNMSKHVTLSLVLLKSRYFKTFDQVLTCMIFQNILRLQENLRLDNQKQRQCKTVCASVRQCNPVVT